MGYKAAVTFLSVIASLTLTASVQAKGPFGSIQIGHWTGGAFTNDNTGQFSGCVATAPYLSGITLGVMINPDGNWGLGFTHQAWRLQQGQSFPIDLTFDGQAQFHVFGTALSASLVLVPMPATSALIAQFRKSQTMSAFAQGQSFLFNLNNTSELLPALAACVTNVKARGLQNAGVFTGRQPAKPAPVASQEPPQVPPAPSALRPDVAQTGSPELQIEAIELASNFIIKSTLHNAKVLSRSETPPTLASYGAAWQAEEATGFVRIIAPQGDTKGIDVAAGVVAADAKDCKGKFASGRASELVDSDVVFRGFSSCDDSDGSRYAEYFIVPRPKGGFVMFSVVSNLKSDGARAVTKDEKLVDFKKAALVSVGR
jgi:hypothetical protein